MPIEFKLGLEDLLKSVNNDQQILRDFITKYSYKQHTEDAADESLNTIIQELLRRFNTDIDLDTQLLIMTTICVLLNSTFGSHEEEYLLTINNVLSFNKTTDNAKLQFLNSELIFEEKNISIFKMCFIHGIFKSGFINNDGLTDRFDLLERCLKILLPACMKYKRTTFLAFRCLIILLQSITKFSYWNLIEYQLVENILFIVNANWENPMSGIREVNAKILNETLQHIDKTIKSDENVQINAVCILKSALKYLSWQNKSKFFILIEIVNVYGNDFLFTTIDYNNERIDNVCKGLVGSLRGGGVTSAGSTLFGLFWDSPRWRDHLTPHILHTMKQENESMRQNLFNYWLPQITKKTPDEVEKYLRSLLDSCYHTSSRQHLFYSIISVLQLYRKSGLGFTSLDKQTDKIKFDLNEFTEYCLLGSNEAILGQTLAFYCVSAKTTIDPTIVEYRVIKNFLINNVNTDCTFLRQSIISSFTLFLIRIRDSVLNHLKINNRVNLENSKHTVLELMRDFFIFLHEFLIENLSPESNYQRKILSLKLVDIILRYFNGGVNNIENLRKGLCRKGNLKTQGIKIQEYLSSINAWQFTSADTIQVLRNCISDPTNDIRELAADILIQYFSDSSIVLNLINDFYIHGTKMCNSSLFYETECGALYVKVLANLIANKPEDSLLSELQIKNEESQMTLTGLFVKHAQSQLMEFKADILYAAVNEKPLFGMLTAINRLVTTQLSNSELTPNILSLHNLYAILSLIEKVEIVCLDALAVKAEDKSSKFAPSFSEMDMSIEYLIQISKINSAQKSNQSNSHLSNEHQIILNCIWMSLKMCSELANSIATLFLKQLSGKQQGEIWDASFIEKCVLVIVKILKSCRHKGAIESAGVALASVTRSITLFTPASRLPSDILQKYVISGLSKNYKGPSITRRGAGMGILLHKLVGGDARRDRPLLTESMNSFFEILEYVHCSGKLSEDNNDVTEACVLHYLKSLVQDSALRTDMSPFMCRVTLVAFKYFQDPSWPVRNAALQLYGAIVPKLVGQKKGSSSTDENSVLKHKEETRYKICVKPDISPCEGIVNLSMDNIFVDVGELLFHLPELTEYMLTKLKKISNNVKSNNGNSEFDLVQTHSSLVPMLSLLSGTTVGVSILYNNHLRDTVQEFQRLYFELFSSPIYVLRELAAKAYVCFSSLTDLEKNISFICNAICTNKSENFKHGALLALIYMVDKLKTHGKNIFDDLNISDYVKISIINLNSKCNTGSYYTSALYFNLLAQVDCINHDIDLLILIKKSVEVSKYTTNIGLCLLIRNAVTNMINKGSNENAANVLNICLEHSYNPDLLKPCLIALISKVSYSDFDDSILNNIFIILFKFILTNPDLSMNVLTSMLQLMQVTFTHSVAGITSDDLIYLYNAYILNKKTSKNISVLVISIICALSGQFNNYDICSGQFDDIKSIRILMSQIIVEISNSIQPELSEDVRLNTARAINSLVSFTRKLRCLSLYQDDLNSYLIIDSVIVLLQDESSAVRIEMGKFYCLIHDDFTKSNEVTEINPSLCLRFVTCISFLKKFCNASEFKLNYYKYLFNKLDTTVNEITDLKKSEVTDVLNPFDHGVSNVYQERNVLKKMLISEISAQMTNEPNSDYIEELKTSLKLINNDLFIACGF